MQFWDLLTYHWTLADKQPVNTYFSGMLIQILQDTLLNNIFYHQLLLFLPAHLIYSEITIFYNLRQLLAREFSFWLSEQILDTIKFSVNLLLYWGGGVPFEFFTLGIWKSCPVCAFEY